MAEVVTYVSLTDAMPLATVFGISCLSSKSEGDSASPIEAPVIKATEKRKRRPRKRLVQDNRGQGRSFSEAHLLSEGRLQP